MNRDGHLEAPWVGNPPDRSAPDNWISDEDRRALEHVIEIVEADLEEIRPHMPDVEQKAGPCFTEVELECLPAFVKVGEALVIEAQAKLDSSVWDD